MLRGTAVLGITVALVGCPENSGNESEPVITSTLDLDAEGKDDDYQMAAVPFNQRPDERLYLSKELNEVEPICHEESATLAVDSILAEAYIKGLGRPAVGFIRDYEFPEIDETSLRDCTDEDIARTNADSLSS